MVRVLESDASDMDVEGDGSLGAYNENEDLDYRTDEDDGGSDGKAEEDDTSDGEDNCAENNEESSEPVSKNEEKYGDDGEDEGSTRRQVSAARPKTVAKRARSQSAKKRPRSFTVHDLIDADVEVSGDDSGDEDDYEARHASDDDALDDLIAQTMDESGDENAVLEKRRSQDLEDDVAQTKAIKGTLAVTFGKKRKKNVEDELDERVQRSQALSDRKEKELAKLAAAREKRKAEVERAKAKEKNSVKKLREDGDSDDDIGFSGFKSLSTQSHSSKEKSRETEKSSASGSVSKYEVFDSFCENGKYYVLTWIAPESPFTTGYPVTLQKSFSRSSLSTCAVIPPGQTSSTMKAYLKQKVAEDEFAGVRSDADQIFYFCAVPRKREVGVSCRLLFTSKKSYTEWHKNLKDSEKTEKKETLSRHRNLVISNTNVLNPTYRLIFHPSHAFRLYRISLRRSKKPEDAETLKRLIASSDGVFVAKPSRAKKAKLSCDGASAMNPSAEEPRVGDEWKLVVDKVKDFEITHSLVVSLCQKVDIIGNRLKELLDSGKLESPSGKALVEKKEEPVDRENVCIVDRPSEKKRAKGARKETASKKKAPVKVPKTADATVVTEPKKASPPSAPLKEEGKVVDAKEKASTALTSKVDTGGRGTKNISEEKKSAAKNIVQSKLSSPGVVSSSDGSKTASSAKSSLSKPPLPAVQPPKATPAPTPVLSSLLADAKKVDESAKKLKEAADATEASVVASYLEDEPKDVDDDVVSASSPSAEDESCYF